MSEVTRHFTATTYIVNNGRVLLHRHQRQGLWFPPGGHIERDELPHDAATREVHEETGLTVRLHSEAAAADLSLEMGDATVVPQPDMVLIEDINPYHQHIDFIYLAATESDDLPDTARRNGFQWLTLEALDGMESVPANVIAGARRAVAWAIH